MRTVSTWMWMVFSAFGVSACLATRGDVQSLAGRVAYLESRLERTEDLVAEASGIARKEVVESRKDINERLERVQQQAADLTTRLQALEIALQQESGRVAVFEQQITDVSARLADIERQVAALEGAASSARAVGGSDIVLDPANFQWAGEKEGYEAALASFNRGDDARARQQFLELLRRWPQGRYAPNAHFWLGEIYFRERDYINAIDRYLYVAEHYGKTNKAPAAYFKMALSLVELGEKAKAKRALSDLLRLYPNSDLRDQAEAALKKLEP